MSDQPQPTPEEVNRAIAESLGYRVICLPIREPNRINPKDKVFAPSAAAEWRRIYPRAAMVRTVPNFWSSLDACAEIWPTLTKEQLDAYRDELQEVCFVDWNTRKSSNPFTAFATPQQHCTAYLRVKGLWRWE